MFGIVAASLSAVSEDGKARYHALYCGLCRALKDRYGQVSRAALTYDLTFFVMLCNSLHEPAEEAGAEHCATHPLKRMPFARSQWSDYAADLAVALAYHKCLDDWHDDKSVKAHAAAAMLDGAYKRAQGRIRAQCALIENAMEATRQLEGAASTPPDACAAVFGNLLGELFAHNQGIWEDAMRAFGAQLGRFIYLMDAAIDLEDDLASGSYNPFAAAHPSREDMRTLLSVLIGDAAATFEKLPLEQDLHLMRSVLYAGVWQKFNEKDHHDRESV